MLLKSPKIHLEIKLFVVYSAYDFSLDFRAFSLLDTNP